MPATVVMDICDSLSFLDKGSEFVAEHSWALIVFVVGLIGSMVDVKSKKVGNASQNKTP